MNQEQDHRTLLLIGQLTKDSSDNVQRWKTVTTKVAIIVSDSSLRYANCRHALAMSVNCLSRLYPVITELDIVLPSRNDYRINSPLFEGDDIKSGLSSFLSKLDPSCNVRLVERPGVHYAAVLAIGNVDYEHESKFTIASDGWVAYVSCGSVSTEFYGDRNENPIGAYLAANFGGMELFKQAFVKKADAIIPDKSDYDVRWRIKHLKEEIRFNAFDYSVNKEGFNPSLPNSVGVDMSVVGAGAGGGACLYTLASLPGLEGTVDVVDPDEINGHNLNRYVYATNIEASRKEPKVDAIKRILSRHEHLTSNTYCMPYRAYSKAVHGRDIQIVVSTVDTSQTRLDIQWDLPKIILDAAVGQTEFYVRQIELGKTACLGCTHYSQNTKEPIESTLSKLTGLPYEEIQRLRINNDVFTGRHIEAMKPCSEKHGFPLPSVGERFQDWFMYHCGELVTDAQSKIRVPLPFSTVIPGILLAGRVIRLVGYSGVIQSCFTHDILSLPGGDVIDLLKDPNCPICSDSDVIKRYRQKYGL